MLMGLSQHHLVGGLGLVGKKRPPFSFLPTHQQSLTNYSFVERLKLDVRRSLCGKKGNKGLAEKGNANLEDESTFLCCSAFVAISQISQKCCRTTTKSRTTTATSELMKGVTTWNAFFI